MIRLLLGATLLVATPAFAQDNPIDDREVTWRTYGAERTARVRVFVCDDERRPHTIVVDDRASNGGAVTDEAQFVADFVGREVGVEPTAATWVFRFTPAAFADGAPDRGKTLLLRAVFRRTSTGALGSPDWRVISRDALDELTDRSFR